MREVFHGVWCIIALLFGAGLYGVGIMIHGMGTWLLSRSDAIVERYVDLRL